MYVCSWFNVPHQSIPLKIFKQHCQGPQHAHIRIYRQTPLTPTYSLYVVLVPGYPNARVPALPGFVCLKYPAISADINSTSSAHLKKIRIYRFASDTGYNFGGQQYRHTIYMPTCLRFRPGVARHISFWLVFVLEMNVRRTSYMQTCIYAVWFYGECKFGRPHRMYDTALRLCDFGCLRTGTASNPVQLPCRKYKAATCGVYLPTCTRGAVCYSVA